LSNIQGYRHSVEELHISKPNLAIQFKEVSSQLEQLAIFSEQKRSVMSEGLGPVASEKQRQRFHRLSKQRDNLIQKIRQVHGFEDFLQAMPFSTLQKVAVEGPVIIVNTSNYRSDAIILQNFGPPILVPLPKATPAEIETLVSNLSAAVKCNPPSQAVVYQVLRTLWDIVVFPIQKKLGALRIPRNSRIWWCPTSYLCALPLHAAGPYVKGQRNLPDLFISSYTSTLSSLIRGRLGGMYRRSLPQLLIMGQPDDTIPRVKEEIEKIHGLWPTAKVLIGGEANDQTVLSYLKQCPWAHFACHGHARKEPFTSSFQLHNDTELTLLKLMQARLPEAEFAFLSACHSAAGDVEGFEGTPDEVITLASAMQFCGFRGVVGTLWAMADLDGPDITLDFYKYMIEKGGGKCKKAAEGLSYATREMRKRNVSVDRWINFMHIGV
jgi:CHAT domain-containing protein